MARRVGCLCWSYGVEAPKMLDFDFGRHIFDDSNGTSLEKLIRQ
jgi:hypothetical protein